MNTNTTISNKLALLGDVHIGVNKNSNDFYTLTKEWFTYFIDDIVAKKINHVVVFGDWHHYRDEISVLTLDISAQIMAMFPKNITVHILTGNHDCYFKDTSEIHSLQMFKGWENVRVYDEVTTLSTVSGKTIKIIPWGYDVKDNSSSDYVFGHFEIKNFKMNNFTICDNGVDSKDILSLGKNVYTGHFHKYQNKVYKSGQITYVGSPFQHNFNDVGNDNGYHILDCDTGECEFVKNVTFPVFKYIKPSDIKTITDDDIYNNFIKFVVDGDMKESVLESSIIKLQSLSPKNLIIDNVASKITVSIDELDACADVINISASINEFIHKMGDIKHKDKTILRLQSYYTNKTKS